MGEFSSSLAFPRDVRSLRTPNEILKHQARASGPQSWVFSSLASTCVSVIPSGLWSSVHTYHSGILGLLSTQQTHICRCLPSARLSLLWMGTSCDCSHGVLGIQNHLRLFRVDRVSYVVCGTKWKGKLLCCIFKKSESVSGDIYDRT